MPKTEFVWVDLECTLDWQPLKGLFVRPAGMEAFSIRRDQVRQIVYSHASSPGAGDEAKPKQPTKTVRNGWMVERMELEVSVITTHGLA